MGTIFKNLFYNSRGESKEKLIAQIVASTFRKDNENLSLTPLKNSFAYQNIEASLTGRFLLPNYQGRVKRFKVWLETRRTEIDMLS